MIVIFPVCNKDIDLGVLHSRWLLKLGGKSPLRALVLAEEGTRNSLVVEMASNLGNNFVHVGISRYPRLPVSGWPLAPNFLFQHTAMTMSRGCRPWFWFEADAVALKQQWADIIEAEYSKGAKPFMGPFVKGMSHVNGVAVYPANTPVLIPSAMKATTQAWDYVAGPEMAPLTHDASHLMTHWWTLNQETGNPMEVGGGSQPNNITLPFAKKFIPETSVMVHRIKDGSLTKALLAA